MKIGQIRWWVLVWGFMVFSCQSLTMPTLHKAHTENSHLDEIEMGTEQKEVAVPGQKTIPDEETLRQFKHEYFSSDAGKQPIFEKYLSKLGTEALLDFLEATYPHCHSVAHELGQAMFAQFKEIGASLRECKGQCTDGCMHGVLMEAFLGGTFEKVTGQLASFCKDDTVSIYNPGNCAHGSGHALMIVTDYDIAKAIAGCSFFLDPAMQYYCATGAFMEYLEGGKPSSSEPEQPKGLHFPCDTYTRFPAACYRYKVIEMLQTLYYDRERVVKECLALPRMRRLGCFHGLGWAYIDEIGASPARLSEICRPWTLDDQNICIEGVIEKLSEFDEQNALAACATLQEENAAVCRAAAKEKMYRMNKPTMGLYIGQ